jgi:hypothetical protein
MDILGYILFTVFAAVVFFSVLGKLLAPKPSEEEETAAAERPRRTEPTPTDVDRFLAEVNRRRREAERQQSQPPVPSPRPEARREPRRDPERRQRPAAVTVRRASEEEARRLPAVQAVEVVEAEPAATAKFQAARLAPGPVSPILTEVASLLRSPRSLGAALVLQEVLGPPLSRRRRMPGTVRPLGHP